MEFYKTFFTNTGTVSNTDWIFRILGVYPLVIWFGLLIILSIFQLFGEKSDYGLLRVFKWLSLYLILVWIATEILR